MRCQCCGARTSDTLSPFVLHLIAGPDPETAITPHPVYTDYAIPASLRAVLAKALPRDELCALCWAWDHGEDLVTGSPDAPVVAVAHADHADRASFVSAADTWHQAQAAARAKAIADAAAAKLAARQGVTPQPIPPAPTEPSAA